MQLETLAYKFEPVGILSASWFSTAGNKLRRLSITIIIVGSLHYFLLCTANTRRLALAIVAVAGVFVEERLYRQFYKSNFCRNYPALPYTMGVSPLLV